MNPFAKQFTEQQASDAAGAVRGTLATWRSRGLIGHTGRWSAVDVALLEIGAQLTRLGTRPALSFEIVRQAAHVVRDVALIDLAPDQRLKEIRGSIVGPCDQDAAERFAHTELTRIVTEDYKHRGRSPRVLRVTLTDQGPGTEQLIDVDAPRADFTLEIQVETIFRRVAAKLEEIASD